MGIRGRREAGLVARGILLAGLVGLGVLALEVFLAFSTRGRAYARTAVYMAETFGRFEPQITCHMAHAQDIGGRKLAFTGCNPRLHVA